MGRKIILLITLLVLTATSTTAQQTVTKKVDNDFTINSRKMHHLFFTLDDTYIEPLNFFHLTEQAIKSIFANLDPYASYLTRDEVQEVKNSFSACVMTHTTQQIAELSKKERLKLDFVRRCSHDYLASFIVQPRREQNSSLDVAYRLNDTVAYIKVNRFSSNTATEIEWSLARMMPLKGVILDLRGNGGGFFKQAIATVDIFLQAGSLIAYTEGRRVARSDIWSLSSGVYERGRLVVLVDEMTASASELVSGALQDWDRAVIIGRPTFGKGVVQQQVEFEDGSAMRVTVARYYTPTGRTIQRPYNLGAYGKTAHKSDTTTYRSFLKRRPLHSEGGIVPDVTIERDTSEVVMAWVFMVESGRVVEMLDSYVERNEEMLRLNYPTIELFAKRFVTPTALIEEVMSGSVPFNIVRSTTKMESMRRLIAGQLKAAIAEREWGGGSYYKILNTQSDNKYITKALEIL